MVVLDLPRLFSVLPVLAIRPLPDCSLRAGGSGRL
ncbi:Hypothetical protein OINT_1002440 [Brucella intermedia LMG 3301]|uniref:Uncharacterized protein n=1 Tax=Brucella intermedia LMG 3301 TaxID=641118 RepID=C4WKM5_9HYPH|nr:Hypothetical protein OINT_1002440 [Brucella intermedia LMG 3301]